MVFFEQEFDNYAEWDLRDIDFVEDDSDILHGKSHVLRRMFESRVSKCLLNIVQLIFLHVWVFGGKVSILIEFSQLCVLSVTLAFL